MGCLHTERARKFKNLQKPVDSSLVEQAFLLSIVMCLPLIYISGKVIFVYKFLKAFMGRILDNHLKQINDKVIMKECVKVLSSIVPKKKSTSNYFNLKANRIILQACWGLFASIFFGGSLTLINFVISLILHVPT